MALWLDSEQAQGGSHGCELNRLLRANTGEAGSGRGLVQDHGLGGLILRFL